MFQNFQAQPQSQLNWALAGSIPSFSVHPAGRPTLRNSIFQADYGLDLKSKVVYLNGDTLQIFIDLNPIGHGGH